MPNMTAITTSADSVSWAIVQYRPRGYVVVVCVGKDGEVLTKEWICKTVAVIECKTNQAVSMLSFYQFPFSSFAVPVSTCSPYMAKLSSCLLVATNRIKDICRREIVVLNKAPIAAGNSCMTGCLTSCIARVSSMTFQPTRINVAWRPCQHGVLPWKKQ